VADLLAWKRHLNRFELRLTMFHRLALCTLLLCMATATGCARFFKKPKTEYQTVTANSRHDLCTAKRKHLEALVFLEDVGSDRDLAKAEQLLGEALVADVTYGPAHNSLGMLYYLQNKLYLAAWEYEYAVKLMPGMAEPYNNLGLIYERVGKYDDAISYYSMALNHTPDDPQVVGNLVRVRMVSGDRSGDLKGMVSELALNHPNPSWQQWARDQVELTSFEEEKSNLNRPWPPLNDLPEALPLPVGQGEAKEDARNVLQFPKSIAPEFDRAGTPESAP
jgi:Tfp pilus assembly protein PilF